MAFHGKVVFLTGGASGMGRLAARRLASAGAQVAALDRNEAGLAETARGYAGIHCWPLDVTERAAVDEAVARTERDLGPIDRVMSAAGIMPTARVLEQDPAEIHRVMAVNYTGSVHVALATFPRLLERGRGDFVQFASASALVPNLHYAAYSASKHAIAVFTEILWQENRGRGVRMACVCPGPVDTPLLDQASPRTKVVRTTPRMRPEAVLDDIERCLERGQLWVFGNWQSRSGWYLRRFAPRLLWWLNHRIEGE